VVSLKMVSEVAIANGYPLLEYGERPMNLGRNEPDVSFPGFILY
jgi:hypothetical protein